VIQLNQIASLALSVFFFFELSSVEAQALCDPKSSLEKILKPKFDAIETGFGRVRTNWADELTGQDLALEILREVKDRDRVVVGLVDSGFEKTSIARWNTTSGASLTAHEDGHGTAVLNTMMSRASKAEVSALFTWEEMQNPKQVEQKLNQLSAQGILPKVLNVSYSMGSTDAVQESFEIMAKKGIILVGSSGNAGDRTMDLNNQRFPGMQVGSSSALGVASQYSQSGEEVDILAPTDYFLRVNFGSKGEHSAEGTSFSAPQVAAAITELVSLLPDLNQQEAEAILKKSALRGVASDGGRNGAGILNVYKAVAVARRMKELGWPANRSHIFEARTYDFRAEAESILQRLEANPKEKERALRQSFYLDQREETRKALVQYYRDPDLALEPMALFFESLAESSIERQAYLERQMNRSDLPISQKQAVARALIDAKGEGVVLASLLGSEKRETLASQKKLLDLTMQVVSKDAIFAGLFLNRQNSRREILLAAADLEEALIKSSDDEARLSLLPLISDDARWNWIRNQRVVKPELALRSLRTISTRPEKFGDFLLFEELKRVRAARKEAFVADFNLEPSPTIVSRLMFDEPKELQPFLRVWYSARTQDEKNRVVDYVSSLVDEWGRVPEDNRRIFLTSKLLDKTKEAADSDILAVAAKQSLQLIESKK